MQQPEVRKKIFLSPIWFLPFLALCIGGWLLYTSYRDKGIDITIHFSSADGITPGKTRVIYRGIPVGTVKSIEINKDLSGIILHVVMKKETKPGLVEDTKFWVVRPEISAGRISGLETLISGSYIAVRKGHSRTPARSFEGLDKPPVMDSDEPGLHIILKTPRLYSLQRGSRIYTKNLAIGRVEDYQLEKDGTIRLNVYIRPEFSHLITTGTRFWNSSGISVSGDLQTGLSVDMESLASLIYGGISCATPKALTDSPAAVSGEEFVLYRDFEQAEYGIPMTLQLATGSGIIAGKTRVLYRGLKAGVVKKIDINNDTFHTVTATILLDPRAEVILRKNTKFWVIRAQVSIEGIKHLDTLITGPYITFQPGDGPYCDHFIVQGTPMPIPTLRPGTHFQLHSRNSGSLSIGTPVLYRKIVVGEITDIRLDADDQGVTTTILIYEPYDHLVKTDSIFWNVSGIQLDASLSQFKLNLSSLRSMIAGGITFFNPAPAEDSHTAPPDTRFSLYESFADAAAAEKALQPQGAIIHLASTAPAPVHAGSPVSFKDIRVGEVTDISLNPETGNIDLQILIYKRFDHLVNRSSRFFIQSGIRASFSLQGLDLETGPLDAVVNGGISFITSDPSAPRTGLTTFPLYEDRDQAMNQDRIAITLHLPQGGKINDKTVIRYQGIEIGRITDVRFNTTMQGVKATAMVEEKSIDLFRSGSSLYLVGPQVDLDGIHNLDTILSGTYISLKPGPGIPAREFTVLPAANMQRSMSGLSIVLESDDRASLKPGSPVYFRQVPVGLVTGFRLAPSGQKVLISATIEPDYAHLVRRGSRFWRVSGIAVSGGLFSGIRLETASMQAMVRGGVAFATPEGEEMGARAADGDHFPLARRPEEEWLGWSPDLTPGRNDTDPDHPVHEQPNREPLGIGE